MSNGAPPVTGNPYRVLTPDHCTHGVTFPTDAEYSAMCKERVITPTEVRERWPRMFGECPMGCGYSGIAYASYMHYLAGDW